MATNMDLNKIQAPALKLYEFNYFANKAVNRYINRVYSAYYDINQQATDDLRVLKSTIVLTPSNKVNTLYTGSANAPKSYEVDLPGDYLHLLNCICVFNTNDDYQCYDKGDSYAVAAKRLTADSWANVIDDVYNAPSALNPYYYIHNVNNYSATSPGHSTPVEFNNLYDLPVTKDRKGNGDSITKDVTSVIKNQTDSRTDGSGTVTTSFEDGRVVTKTYADGELVSSETKYNQTVTSGTSSQGTGTYTNFPRTITLKDGNSVGDTVSTVEKPGGLRNANPVGARMEIRCGDTSICELKQVHVDYIKSPQYLRLTQKLFDSTRDISQILEFPDYICQEIENELLTLVMEHSSDPRLKNTILMNLTIARPSAQQLSTEA